MHGTIVAVERKKWETWVGSGRVGSGRVGSGRVGSGERCFLSDWTLTSLFFSHHRDYRAVYWALRLASFEQAMLSLDKLSKYALMQNTTDFYRYFLRVSNGNSY